MRWFHRDPLPQRSQKFDDLARYNSERGRGIVHTRVWEDRMDELQAEFVEWSKEQQGKNRSP